MIPIEKIQNIINKHDNIEKELSSGSVDPKSFAEKSKEYSSLGNIISLAREYVNFDKEIIDLENIIEDKNNDAEMLDMAEKDLIQLKIKKTEYENRLKIFLLPKDEDDDKNAIVEIRAGTGGLEASLFCSDLFKMYERVCSKKKWKLEIINISKSEAGGFKEVVFSVNGNDIYSYLKYESGVHRVQRIPETETQGRVHTSAATVAVLPEAEDVDIQIKESDLRIDVFRAGGPGGQSVNTTDSAVRITHLTSKIVVQCQNERSQHKNKETCMNMLKARLYDYEIKKREEQNQNTENSKSEIGWGHQIRSYVLQPYRLVKDNRTNFESTSPDKILDGDLDEFLEQSLYKIK